MVSERLKWGETGMTEKGGRGRREFSATLNVVQSHSLSLHLPFPLVPVSPSNQPFYLLRRPPPLGSSSLLFFSLPHLSSSAAIMLRLPRTATTSLRVWPRINSGNTAK